MSYTQLAFNPSLKLLFVFTSFLLQVQASAEDDELAKLRRQVLERDETIDGLKEQVLQILLQSWS